MIYNRTMSHPEYGVHAPLSHWTKNMIVRNIGGQYKTRWMSWTMEDLKTLLIKDGTQHAGTKNGELHGHCVLYCLDLPRITMIESAWMEEDQ